MEGAEGRRRGGRVVIIINSVWPGRDASCFGLVAGISYFSRLKLARLTVKVKSAVTGERLVEAARSHSIPAPRAVALEKRRRGGMGLTPGWR